MQEKLQKYSLTESEYRAWRQQIRDCVSGPPRVHFVQLDNRSRFSDEIIRELITIRPGETLDLEQLDGDLRQIYGLGFIREATYSVVVQNGKQGIQITVHNDERGTQFIETGLDLSFSQRGTVFNLRGGYLNAGLDERGSEFRALAQVGESPGLFVDYFRPLDDELKYNFRPGISVFRRPLLIYTDEGDAVSEIVLDEIGAAVTIGREFGRYAGLYAGYTRYTGEIDITVGDPTIEEIDFDGAEFYLELLFDQLDDRYLPTKGWYSAIKYTRSSEKLGADTSFDQLEAGFVYSKSFGLHNIIMAGQFNTSLDDDIPPYAWYTGGGFLNMSGFEPNSLVGSHFGHLTLGYRYQVGKSGFLPGYAGMTLEYGNVAFERDDVFSDGLINGSVYFAYGSPLGPIYLGAGWSEEFSALYFVRVGALFGPRALGRR
jgi:NTE family protein